MIERRVPRGNDLFMSVQDAHAPAKYHHAQQERGRPTAAQAHFALHHGAKHFSMTQEFEGSDSKMTRAWSPGRVDAEEWQAVTIKTVRQETPEIFVFDLRLPTGLSLPAFEAGAHIDVKIGEFIRQYSLCGAPHDLGRYEIAVKRERDGRGGSRLLCDAHRPGDVLAVRGPRNTFKLVDTPSQALLIAGGIGITPLLSMAEHLHARGRRFALHYLSRSMEQTAFRERIRTAAYAPSIRHHFDSGAADQQLDLSKALSAHRDDSHLYVCGPGAMIDSVVETAKRCGWRDSHIHFERFAASGAHSGPETGFHVELRSSGKVIAVPPGMTVVQALREFARVSVPVSCEEGVCGTCLVGLHDGLPDHRDSVLTPDERRENKLFVPCCSRAFSETLVLDI